MEKGLLYGFEKKKQYLIYALFVAVCFVQTAYSFFFVKQRNAAMCRYVLAAGAGLLVIVTVAYFFAVIKNASAEKMLLFGIIALGLFYTALFPQITVPDEQAHFRAAYKISNCLLFRFKNPNGMLEVRKEDLAVFDDMVSKVTPSKYRFVLDNFTFFATKKGYGTAAPFDVNCFTGYIFSALGITVGRIFNLGVIPTFYLGRIFNLAAYTVFTYIAVKRIPTGKAAIVIISLLPMSIHLAGSYSYDGPVIAYAILFVSQVMYISKKDGKATKSDIIFCTVFGMLLAPTKVVYFPLLALAIAIPSEKISEKKRTAWLVKIGIIAVGMAFMLALQLANIKATMPSERVVDWADKEKGYTLGWAFGNIKETIFIYLRTLIQKGDWYFTTMVGSSLGWFQIEIPLYMYMPFVILFFAAAIRRNKDELVFTAAEKVIVLCLVVFSAVLVFTSMFFAWTPMSSNIILGVQGRYFIPLLVPLVFVVGSRTITAEKRLDRYIIACAFLFNSLILIKVLETALVTTK